VDRGFDIGRRVLLLRAERGTGEREQECHSR
jgi:hypothetical protein